MLSRASLDIYRTHPNIMHHDYGWRIKGLLPHKWDDVLPTLFGMSQRSPKDCVRNNREYFLCGVQVVPALHTKNILYI
jgi:hypothetical protein